VEVAMRLSLNAEKIKRHQAFLNRLPVNRPLIGSWLFGFYIHQQYPRVAASMLPGEIKPEDIPIELFLEDVDELYEAYSELDDDYPFSMGAFYGIPWMEAIMGCPIYFSGTTMWAGACIQDWETYKWNSPDLENNAWFQKLLEFLRELVKHSNGRFACGPTLMRGIADMCAAMRTPTNLALDLYDHPETVRRLAEICSDVWINVGKAQLDLVPESENGYIIGCAGLRCWMPEKGIWIQDDSVSVLSPKFYKLIFLDLVRQIASRFPTVAFHLHGNTLWPVDLLLDLEEIDVLEVNYDVGVCKLEDVVAAWKRIQEKKPCIGYADLTLEQLDRSIAQWIPNGLSIQNMSPTMDEAKAKRDLVYKYQATLY
jgi:hypothetical protein